MKRSFVLQESLLQKLAEDDKLENVILGTGAMARDMQAKLRLLNVKTSSFLVGGVNDLENGIRHYKSLENLDNPQNYRFICCYDTDEWMLIMPTFSVVYKILGSASWNHPKVLRFSSEPTLFENAGEYRIDVHTQDCHLRDGNPYVALGSKDSTDAFKIHIFGQCPVSGTYRFNESTLPELLYSKLHESGFNSIVYPWGQPINTIANSLIALIRDARFMKPDLVIVFMSMRDLNPICVEKKNALAVNTMVDAHISVERAKSLFPYKINNGIDHDTDLTSIAVIQDKIFNSLAKLNGFSYWNVFGYSSDMLAAKQSERLLGLSSGYLSRVRSRKENIINALNSPHVRDYTDTFDDVHDIFSIFSDSRHLTIKGNEMLAQRLATDILTEFRSRSSK